jgi:hypothetical protein
MQPEKSCDKEDDDDDADDVENVHGVLRLRHARFQSENAALQYETSRPAGKFQRPRSHPAAKVVNFIQTDVANGQPFDSGRVLRYRDR